MIHHYTHVKCSSNSDTKYYTGGLLLVYWTKLLWQNSIIQKLYVALSVQFFSSLIKACVEQKCSVLYCCVSGMKLFCHIWLWSHETLDESLPVWSSTMPQYIVPRWDFLSLSLVQVLYENGVNGILADEMGLGKTIQCISVIAHMVEMGAKGPFLIAAPLSTVANWVGEFRKFTPTVSPRSSHITQKSLTMLTVFTIVYLCILDKKKPCSFRALTYKMWPSNWLNQSWFSFVQIPVVLYHGTIPERERLRRKMFVRKRKGKPEEFQPVVVTSYEICMKDQKFLCNRNWKFLVVDEGHRIKNLNCKLIKWVGRIAETLVSCKYNLYVSIAFQSSEVVWRCQQAAAHWHPAAE